MPINLMYHDVTAAGAEDSSGFSGPESARYKLTPADFSEQLDRISIAVEVPPSVVSHHSTESWTITFDDGGVSAVTVIANELEKRGWRGWFFIPTDFIGQSGFCGDEQLRDLHRRGHLIGSHTCSHPPRISSLPVDQIFDEWTRSCAVLSKILGTPIVSASVPCGFYSKTVAQAAARAGIRMLFTSEPTVSEFVVDDCLILGRYNIYRGMSPDDAASLISSPLRRWRQSVFWNTKKAAKNLAGPLYSRLRSQLLSRAYGNRG